MPTPRSPRPAGRAAAPAAPVIEVQSTNNLEFENTQSPSKFKTEQGVASIEVKENPKKPGSYFMTDESGNLLGGVSPNLIDAQASGEPITPVISWVTPKDDPDAESFFLLHRKGEGAETIFSL